MKDYEKEQCIDIITEAFFDYEYFSIYVSDEKKRAKFIHDLVRTEVLSNLRTELFFVLKEDEKIIGVAALYPPNFQNASDFAFLKNGFFSAMIHGGPIRTIRWMLMEREAKEPCLSLKDDTWLLNILVIRREEERKGYGTKMIQDYLIPYVRRNGGKAMSLFTNSQENQVFYQKVGLEIFDYREFHFQKKTIGSWSFKIPV